MNVSARAAVVSGGSSGIGKAIVARLHADGWTVYTCGRDRAKLAALEAELPGVRTHVCDVGSRAAVLAFAQSVFAEVPTLQLLVSNAGGSREIDFTREDLSSLDVTAELRNNTEGAINLITEFLPGLRHNDGGAILVVSSGYALAPATRAPVYCASKAALHSLCKSLRLQLAPLRITVTELLPPVVDTPSVAHRKVAKLAPGPVADAAVRGVLAGSEEVRPGKVRCLPFLLRLMPRTSERIVART